MKITLGIVAVIVVAASIFADYKWRQWIAARKLERESHDARDRTRETKQQGPAAEGSSGRSDRQ